ncbi:MAG: asparaginase, partial [Anaerolineales bacterium]|nr:asparaginase [Anaerolineales bacterium]
MDNSNPIYLPVLELTRGGMVESVHFGAFCVVDAQGQLLAAHGDPQLVTFLRSSAKPFQALPFIEKGGGDYWDFSPKQIAIMCASHSGTDDHFETIRQMQAKIQVSQDDLLCGTHLPGDQETAWRLIRNHEQPTQNRHNCSGKHTGMLASARMQQLAIEDYLDYDHPIQRQILQAFSEMCSIAPEQVVLGIDG